MNDDLLKGKTLIIVDDEEDLRDIIASELQYFGAKVFQASSVQQAYDLIEQNSIDAVISDIRMPGKSGIDLLNMIRVARPTKPAVLLITGFADLETAEALALGADALIHKPFDMDELLSTVCYSMASFPEKFKRDVTCIGELHFHFNENVDDSISKTVHIGRGGICILNKDQPLPLNTNRKITLHFKDKTLCFVGMIRWKHIEDKQTKIGIEFINISDDMIPLLDLFKNKVSYIPN